MVSSEEAQHYDSFDESAVYVRNALKRYGFGKRQSNILKSLNMTVKKGTIYGLLGASGCGKTTLLSCIVGRRSLDSGEIYVFGGEPGTKESSIPGPRVGYMPQELALYGEFTIKETLEYFGRLYRLPKEFVNSQMDYLFKLLDLPPGHRYVKSLSGGQQRRVSFAVALFHDPELLILDEPTVGVDPLIRERIWNHLVKLSTVNGRTIIITTHYIEEARQSHMLGMMRNGRLLAEQSPESLLVSQNLNSLEDVFLKLCVSDNGFNNYVNDKKSDENITSSNINNNNNQPKCRKCTSNDFVLPSFHRTFAVTQKNLIQTFRNIGLLTFILVFPAVAVSLFCLAIGHDPTSLDIGIVNDELTQGSVCHYDDTCNYSMLSCRFLRFLTNETIIQIQYSNYTEAFEAFQDTKIYGVIHFGKNFSDDLKLREINGADTAIETILGSSINVQLDWTSE